MSLSREDSDLVSNRASVLTPEEASVIDLMFDNLWSAAAEAGVPADRCDECAKLEAAAIRYLIASRAA